LHADFDNGKYHLNMLFKVCDQGLTEAGVSYRVTAEDMFATPVFYRISDHQKIASKPYFWYRLATEKPLSVEQSEIEFLFEPYFISNVPE
jgi:hypothetical protein